jgi:hypothetical protein
MVVSCYISSIKNVPMIPWTEKRWFRPLESCRKETHRTMALSKNAGKTPRISCVNHLLIISYHVPTIFIHFLLYVRIISHHFPLCFSHMSHIFPHSKWPSLWGWRWPGDVSAAPPHKAQWPLKAAAHDTPCCWILGYGYVRYIIYGCNVKYVKNIYICYMMLNNIDKYKAWMNVLIIIRILICIYIYILDLLVGIR